jgi:hypothetical protein
MLGGVGLCMSQPVLLEALIRVPFQSKPKPLPLTLSKSKKTT